jgi:hypothetical protein
VSESRLGRHIMSSESFDDMHDSPAETGRFTSLPLDTCRSITARFVAKDKDALNFQENHVWLTRGAASFGTLAVLAAIVGLSGLWVTEKQVASVELAVVGLAFAFAAYGLATSQKYEWLAQRHQAELCRQLKFRFLIRPAAWADADWLAQEKQNIETYSNKAALERAIEDALPHGPFSIAEQQLPRQTFEHLVEYYISKRLTPQMEYLANRAQRNEYKDRVLSLLPAILFFASVAAAAAHFGLSYCAGDMVPREFSWAVLAALLAACLPVIAAWVRTVRAAFEFSRNKSRFTAAHRALSDLEDLIVRDSMDTVSAPSNPAGGDVDPRTVLRELWWCEQIFATEHREWLRLMVETEWYG